MENNQKGSRDISWDIVKAICIILMVFAHTRAPLTPHYFIFMFHMGVFYFVAGYFLKTGESFKQTFSSFFKRKIISLYRPYVIFGLLMVWLSPLMYKWHWESSAYNFQEIVKYSIKTILFAGPLGYGIALWFLKSLFFSLGILLLILQTIKSEKKRACVVLVLYSLGWTIARYKIDVPWSLARDITVVSLCYLGYIARKFAPPYCNGFKQSILYSKGCRLLVSLCFIVIMLFFSRFVVITVLDEKYSFYGALPLFCLMGTYICKTTADIIVYYTSIVCKCLSFIGRHTLAIMMWHLIAMKLVSYFIILVYKYPIDSLAEWTIDVPGESWWCYIYTIIGVCVPLLLTKGVFAKIVFKQK